MNSAIWRTTSINTARSGILVHTIVPARYRWQNWMSCCEKCSNSVTDCYHGYTNHTRALSEPEGAPELEMAPPKAPIGHKANAAIHFQTPESFCSLLVLAHGKQWLSRFRHSPRRVVILNSQPVRSPPRYLAGGLRLGWILLSADGTPGEATEGPAGCHTRPRRQILPRRSRPGRHPFLTETAA